jgi:hypothetical protein
MKMNIKLTLKMKKVVTLKMDISYTEETDKEKIEERIGKQIEESEGYAVLHVTRWSKTINGVYFYIDSTRSECFYNLSEFQSDKDAEVNNWYTGCGCRAKDLECH